DGRAPSLNTALLNSSHACMVSGTSSRRMAAVSLVIWGNISSLMASFLSGQSLTRRVAPPAAYGNPKRIGPGLYWRDEQRKQDTQPVALNEVREYLREFDKADEIIEFDTSSATVELAAEALGTKPERIAKTLAFLDRDDP